MSDRPWGVIVGAGIAGVLVVGLLAYEVLGPGGARNAYPVEDPPSALVEVATARAAFALAHAVLEGGVPGDGPPGEGVPTYLCGWRVGPRPVCARGEGDTLASAVRSAAAALGPRLPKGARPTLSLDFETHVQDVTVGQPGHRKRDPGLWGWRRPGVPEAVLTPAQVLAFDVFGGPEEDDKRFRPEQLVAELQARGAEAPPLGDDEALQRFRTVAWLETEDGPLRTYRLHAHTLPATDPDSLRVRAAWAAEHLASTVRPNGRVRYLYDVSEGRELPGYNLLRHGGTTYSLLQGYQRFGHEAWLQAAEAAIGHLLRSSRRDVRHGPYGGGETLWVNESRHVKLGGAGLALVMLTQHAQATGADTHLDDARAYARFLVSQQMESGEFVSFAPLQPGGEGKDQVSAYYPGEAILGLMQLHAIDPDPLWLATARRGADWLIDVRDAGLGPEDLANDHWLMIALSHLVRATDDPRYVAHSRRLAEAVAHQAERNRSKVATHADYRGSYYDPPRSTPAATRGEGLVAVLDTCAHVNDPCDEVLDLLLDTVGHELWAQYTPDTVWWMPRPAAAVGGFSGGIMDPDLRNDYTQHNLSSVLGLERHLRAREGVVLPGGPTWSWARQRAWSPPPARQVSTWLEPVRHFRGPLVWDRPNDPEAP